jgi:hypothetical protein
MRPLQTILIAALLTASAAQAQPRHIYRDGNYFFCPSPDYDPYCRMPNDYSVALHPPLRPGPPEPRPAPPIYVPSPGYVSPPGLRTARPVLPLEAPSAPLTMDEDRERVIRLGEEHCRRFPQDTQVCHPPKPQ